MAFRINRGIFKFYDPTSTTYKPRYKFDDNTGKLVELDDDGNTVSDALTTAGGTVSGALTAPSYYVGSSNVQLHTGGNNALRITSPTGWVQFGSENSSYAHFNTDRATFYFNRQIEVAGHAKPYTDNTYNLGTSSLRWNNVYTQGLSVYGNGTVNGNLVVGGTITAQEFHTEFVNQTIIQETGDVQVDGELTFTGAATTSNQSYGITWSGFDKEGTTDFSDSAYIKHTTNTGGFSGSVLVIHSANDSNDGIAFSTHASSDLRHNGNIILTAGNYTGTLDSVYKKKSDEIISPRPEVGAVPSGFPAGLYVFDSESSAPYSWPFDAGIVWGIHPSVGSNYRHLQFISSAVGDQLMMRMKDGTNDSWRGWTHLATRDWVSGQISSSSGISQATADGRYLQLTGGPLTGDLQLLGNQLLFNGDNVAAPSTTDQQAGTRILLYPSTSGQHYAIGIESSNMWFNSDGGYKWYNDANNIASLSSSGVLYVNGGNSGQWNTAYSWGNHASAGYQKTSGTTTTLNMNNQNITNVNSIAIGDPGPGEGLLLQGGNDWRIYESPNDLTTNSAGNLQFVRATTRVMTLNTDHNVEIPNKLLIGGANDNSGKADFAVGNSNQISWMSSQVQIGATDMNWGGKAYYSSGFHIGAWDVNLRLFNQGSAGNNRDIEIAPQRNGSPTEVARFKGDGYMYFPGLEFAISTVNSDHGIANYFRGSNTHLVIGTGGTLYLNYGNSTGQTRIYGNHYHNDQVVLDQNRVLRNITGTNDVVIGTSAGGTSNKLSYNLAAQFTLPAAGTRVAIMNVAASTVARVTITGSENGYFQPINLFITRNNTTVTTIIRESVRIHSHSNDVMFSTDSSGNIYAEKSLSTGRPVVIRKIEQFTGNITVLNGSTTDTGVGSDQSIIGIGNTDIGTNTVWHSGNDGSGSGLDADTVDGIQANQFLRSDADDTATSNITVVGDLRINNSADHNRFEKGSAFINPRDPWDNFHLHGEYGAMYFDSSTYFFRSTDQQNTWVTINSNGIGIATSPTSGYKLTMGGGINMSNNAINYVDQLHFNNNLRFVDEGNDSYLRFKYGDTGAGGIKVLDGNDNVKGFLYGSGSGFGLLNQDGQWAVLTTATTTTLLHDGVAKLNTRSNGIEVTKTGTDSYIYFPAQNNDPGFIRHYESNNTARMYFSVSDDNNTTDYFGFGYSGDQNRFRIFANGQWQSEGSGVVVGDLTVSRIIDYNNTNYYLDPNGTSRLNEIDVNLFKGFRDRAYKTFTVDGDADTFYPVRIGGSSQYGLHRYSISRGYSAPAPDTWNTTTHRGGLTLTIDWTGDTAWGGNDKTARVVQFDETYTTVAGGLTLPVTGGLVVWLRGGGAQYQLHAPNGSAASVTVELNGYTAGNGDVYSPRDIATAQSTGHTEIHNRWPVRDNNLLYHGNQQVATESWVTGTAKAADANKLDGYDWMQSGKSVRANEFYADNWFRNYNAGEGIFNENTGAHWYSDATNNWNTRSSSTSSAIHLHTDGVTRRGSLYANNSNHVGLLDAGGSWAVKHRNDEGTQFYTDGETLEFTVGRDLVTGNYGTVQTSTTRSSWGGYSINGQYVFMSDHSNRVGIFNDVDNEWMLEATRNADLKLYHNGTVRLTTTGSGVTINGYIQSDAPAAPSVTAANIVGDTIEVVFNASATGNIDYYQVWSSVAGGSYGLIAQIPESDFAATMTVIDSTFSVSGTIDYRVYAVKSGVYSAPGTISQTYTTPALDVVGMSVVNLNTAYYIQYDLPDSRFVDHIEIYMDAEANSANLTRTGATLVYSGDNTSYMYQVGAADLDKYHQFWVEVIES